MQSGPSRGGPLEGSRVSLIYTLEILYLEMFFRVTPLVQSLAPEPWPYRERALWLGTELSLRTQLGIGVPRPLKMFLPWPLVNLVSNFL